jgi:hypothetical protein
MACIFTKRDHLQCVDIVGIRKIAPVEEDRTKADVRSPFTDMDTTDCHEVLRGPSVGIIQILAPYRVSPYAVFVLHLQLWYLHLLVSVQSAGDFHSRVLKVVHFMSHGDAAPAVKTHQHLDNVARIPVQQYQLDYCRHRRLTVCRRVRRIYIP